ncbi:MAG: alpha/beta hydrolase [Dermatophilaceae bacterium]
MSFGPSRVPSRVLPWALRAVRANRVFATGSAAHRRVAELALRPRPYGPPRLIRRAVTFEVRRRFGWPVYEVRPRVATPRGRVVYVHGGGWVGEITALHWHLVAQIAAEVGTTVTVPIYPLVPFGTAGEVVPRVAELAALTAEHQGGPACLVGDSAGGQIALSAAMVARDTYRVLVPRTVLLAPGLDLSLDNPEIDDVQPFDPWLAVEGARVLADYWRGDLPVDDPLVSPLFGEFSGLGPLSVFCGTRDILNPDARTMVERARAAGVDVSFHEAEGLVHVYPLTPTPEGRLARRQIVEDLRAALA